MLSTPSIVMCYFTQYTIYLNVTVDRLRTAPWRVPGRSLEGACKITIIHVDLNLFSTNSSINVSSLISALESMQCNCGCVSLYSDYLLNKFRLSTASRPIMNTKNT